MREKQQLFVTNGFKLVTVREFKELEKSRLGCCGYNFHWEEPWVDREKSRQQWKEMICS